ncbi:integral memnbrane protein [Campylobacter jejuni]
MRYKLAPLFILELLASIVFILVFDFGNFLFFILLSMLFGVVLLAISWKNMVEFRILDFKSMLSQFSLVIAGFLFIFPGVITSVLGLMVLLFSMVFKINLKSRSSFKNNSKDQNYEEIIDVEIIEDRK